MKQYLLWCLLLAASSLAISGCGTIANTIHYTPEQGGHRLYGGVQQDLSVAREVMTDPKAGLLDTSATMFLATADIPFSLVGDTLTLPVNMLAASGAQQTYTPPLSHGK